ncbi:DUF1559 domain-containing protein [Botrimarina mediterranea]|uniref:DUF1559 domain-containing protein n=1 Tax=Botrimarina mediterranea TaxID=2528022 RepID=A0A518K2B7_9BACT|nr:DUF1559 domain-containing protein [Botrimarina mediterranea]QDV71910.1 hypothetical protein Spa11_00790 [Botrimarina mediterranea]QDV76451.1 hypothetical protein K2D_00290 [Planctomycetes bacterium K2D]
MNRGHTIIELLVSMGVIGALASLLLPGVQSARESGRRASCQNNLRQVGVALLQHEATHIEFPVGAAGGGSMGVSWMVRIAPYLEEMQSYDRLDLSGGKHGLVVVHAENGRAIDGLEIATLACPSSLIPQLRQVGAFQLMMPSYVGVSGASNHDGFPEQRVAECCIPRMGGQISAGGVLVPNYSVRAMQITDGLSNTLVTAECSSYSYTSDGRERRIDGGFPNGWIAGTAARGVPPEYHPGFAPPSWNIVTVRYTPNTADYDLPGVDDNRGPNNPFTSNHPNGVYAGFADGRVVFLDEKIDLSLFKSLVTRDAN